jgi:hypothetical protein
MQSRAVEETRKIGFGSCGSGAPAGRSTQMRQPRIAAASAARPSAFPPSPGLLFAKS